MTDNPQRQFELAWGIRVAKDPHDMTRPELEDALYSVADYASRRLAEAGTLKNILRNAISSNNDRKQQNND